MTLEKAQRSIGKLVMSTDAGNKMIRSVSKAHGPYRLLKITKGGLAILEGREDFRIAPSLIQLFKDPKPTTWGSMECMCQPPIKKR